MNTRFCAQPGCGGATTYTAVKPAFCSKCGNPFGAAFATAPIPVTTPIAPLPVPRTAPIQSRPPSRRFVGSRGRPVAPVEEPIEDSQIEGGDNEYVDNNEIEDAAQALASTISSSDFSISTDDSEGAYTSMKLGSILKPYMEQMNADKANAKPARKSRKKSV